MSMLVVTEFGMLAAEYEAEMQPIQPCREMPTRHCPATYEGVCGDRPCARFESDDETPWLLEVGD